MADSASAWKKAIRQDYQSVIIGSQKTVTNLVMRGTRGVGVRSVQINTQTSEFHHQFTVAIYLRNRRKVFVVLSWSCGRHVVYWNHNWESGAQQLKVNLIVYDNDVMQVRVAPHPRDGF